MDSCLECRADRDRKGKSRQPENLAARAKFWKHPGELQHIYENPCDEAVIRSENVKALFMAEKCGT